MDLIQAIKINAFLSVIKPDNSYQIRFIQRWYSKTFSTPLSDVGDILLEDLLQAFFEEKFEGMEKQDLESIKAELLETEEEKQIRIKQEDEARDDADTYARFVESQEEKSKQKTDIKTAKLDKQAALAKIGLRSVGSFHKGEKESVLPIGETSPLPPDISMVFSSDEEFENEISDFGVMGQPKKKRS